MPPSSVVAFHPAQGTVVGTVLRQRPAIVAEEDDDAIAGDAFCFQCIEHFLNVEVHDRDHGGVGRAVFVHALEVGVFRDFPLPVPASACAAH